MSFLDERFALDEYDTDVPTEVIAGLTTFLTMSYIIVVNPNILADALMTDPAIAEAYDRTEVMQMLAVVTILASFVAILVMAFWADRPFGLAPGMGLNAFFTYTVVIGLGIPWQTALAAVFVEGVLFILLTAVGARSYIIELFPEPVKFGVGAGIGAFLLFLGFQEMQVVVPDEGTVVTLGEIASNPVASLALIGLFVTLILYARGITGSIVFGILATTIAAWALTFAGFYDRGVLTPSELTSAQYDISPLVGAFLDGLRDVDPVTFFFVVFTFFFVDFFDTAGTLIGVSQIAGFLDEDGNLPEMDKPLMADAVGTTVGAMLGTSTVTTFVESSTGVEEGGRTGLTALVVGIAFLVTLAIVPLVAAIPQYASYIALVVVGIIMLQGVADIDWTDPAWSISGGFTIVMMPLTMSIAEGIAAGIITYPVVKAAVGESYDVRPGQWLLAAVFAAYYFLQTSGLIL